MGCGEGGVKEQRREARRGTRVNEQQRRVRVARCLTGFGKELRPGNGEEREEKKGKERGGKERKREKERGRKEKGSREGRGDRQEKLGFVV